MTTTNDEHDAYKRGRAAIKNLTTKDRNFNWWLDYSNAIVAVRTEAMRDAFTNQPVGKAYNANHARIMRREKLDGEFDDNTRKDCVAMVDNLHHPVDARRAHGILAWRSGLDASTRARLNHPTSIMRRWKKDTEPLIEKQAGSMGEPKKSPFLDALGDAELERDDARRSAQDLRALLGRVLDEAEDLPDLLRAAIQEALR